MYVIANFSLTFSKSRERFTVYLQTLTFNQHLYRDVLVSEYPLLTEYQSISRISPHDLKKLGLYHPQIDFYIYSYDLRDRLLDMESFLSENKLIKRMKKKERYLA